MYKPCDHLNQTETNLIMWLTLDKRIFNHVVDMIVALLYI